MRAFVIPVLLTLNAAPVAAVEAGDWVAGYCDLVKKRALNLLDWRFSDDFDLLKAKRATHGEPMFESMLMQAWATQPSDDAERRAEQIKRFGEQWYGQCIMTHG